MSTTDAAIAVMKWALNDTLVDPTSAASGPSYQAADL